MVSEKIFKVFPIISLFAIISQISQKTFIMQPFPLPDDTLHNWPSLEIYLFDGDGPLPYQTALASFGSGELTSKTMVPPETESNQTWAVKAGQM